MFSHVTLGTNSLDVSAELYDALLTPLGLVQREVEPDGGPMSRCWIQPGSILPRFYLYGPYDGNRAAAGNGTMVAFLAPSPESVDAAYAAGIDAGGLNEGPPGPRDHYGKGYYGAYLRDPDGNKLHVAFRGDLA